MTQTSDWATTRRAMRLASLRPRLLTSGRWRAVRGGLTVLMGAAAVIAGVQLGLNAPDVSPVTPPAAAVAAGAVAGTAATTDDTTTADDTTDVRDEAGRGPGGRGGRDGGGR
jgi:negative regulator of sigma E activity